MNLSFFFHPKSIAIVGISSKNFNAIANVIFMKNIFSHQIKVYGISKNAVEFQGEKIYSSLRTLPETPDIVVSAAGANLVLDLLDEAIALGVKGAILIEGGFGETGEEGLKLQNQVRDKCLKANFPAIGPNCIGIYSPPYIDTLFVPEERCYAQKPGNVAVISQSGGILFDQLFQSFVEYGRNIGVSSVVSIGNKAVLDEADFLEYFNNDPKTDVIIFYIEGFTPGAGRKFVEIAQKSTKDIIIYPGGQTDASLRVIKSHTGTLATNNIVAESAYKQYGITVAHTERECINFAKVFSVMHQQQLLKNCDFFDGTGIAIITQSGGHGVTMTDLIQRYGMSLTEFTAEEQEMIRNLLTPIPRRIGSMQNPFDLTGSACDEDIMNTLQFLIQNPKVKCIIHMFFPYVLSVNLALGAKMVEMIETIKPKKPIIFFVPRHPKWEVIRGTLEVAHLPCALTAEEAVIMAYGIMNKKLGEIRKASRRL